MKKTLIALVLALQGCASHQPVKNETPPYILNEFAIWQERERNSYYDSDEQDRTRFMGESLIYRLDPVRDMECYNILEKKYGKPEELPFQISPD